MNKKNFSNYRLGDIFEILTVKKANKNNLSKIPTAEYHIPVVYAKFGDNGIMYWGKDGEFTTYSNVISIVYNGIISAGKVYAHERKTGILAESYFIRIKNQQDIPFEANLYMATVIEYIIYPKYSRDNLATWKNKVENEIIPLPTIDGTKDEIDFNYMKDYINSIKQNVLSPLITFLSMDEKN